MADRGLYEIDETLLRYGRRTLCLALAAAAGVALYAVDHEGAIGRAALPLAGIALCPVALLAAGTHFRRQEQRMEAIWSLLRQHVVLDVRDLVANSDFDRNDLARAVRLLNNRALGHYVWDEKREAIVDARLKDTRLHVEKCDVCGGSMALEVPAAFVEIPRCPYCHDPVSIEGLLEQRKEAIDGLRIDPRADETVGPGRESGGMSRSFSPGLFLVLTICFWPAALVYAWSHWRRGD